MRSAEKRKLYLIFAIVLAATAAAAFIAAWALFRQPPLPPPPPETVVTAEQLAPFFAAAEQSDYDAMRRLGETLFPEGARIPDSKTLLAEYETNSFPPHVVYAFHSRIGPESTRRVLLTMDDNDKVVSFLAEEMAVTK